MWQRGLAPSGVEETDASVLISHIGSSRLDDLAIEVESEGERASFSSGL
jgi:hypothetical protein